MSQERYGIRRFALLNTAGYSLGLFPLEHPQETAALIKQLIQH